MSKKLGVIMDHISTIKSYKDSTFAMMLAAQNRGWELFHILQSDMAWREGKIIANAQSVSVRDDNSHWYDLEPPCELDMEGLDAVLMRKDPPFDMEYIYTTYLLEALEASNVLIVNRPRSLRDVNEKFFTTRFPQCAPPQIITRDPERIRQFLSEHKEIVVKPLDGMGGASIFRIDEGDLNTNVILETVLDHGRKTAVAQRFLPEYTQGDKRILLIDGEPVTWALARIPAKGEARANLAAGGSWEGVALTERDHWICSQVAPELKERGLIFVGLDVIGDYLTEINVTSPTCIRELDQLYDLDIGGQLIDCLDTKLTTSNQGEQPI
ncbi:MAG TPA: glutathione synthase [Gammaproteobacteria bacterium]|nr:glutathione synthase [Gammaproteobacteria bacterium]